MMQRGIAASIPREQGNIYFGYQSLRMNIISVVTLLTNNTNKEAKTAAI